MNSTVIQEFGMFCSHTKHLKEILAKTQICFKEINDAAIINGNQTITAELSKLEETQLESLVKRPPGIVIIGQTAEAKATVVNELLGKNILPACPAAEHNIFESAESSKREGSHNKRRTVRMKYGKKQRVTFCLANSFELVEEITCVERAWKTVPLEVLLTKSCDPVSELNEQVASIKEEGIATKGACQNISDEYVKENSKEIISSCCEEQETDPIKLAHYSSNSYRDASGEQDSSKALSQNEDANPRLKKDELIVEVMLNHPLFSSGAQIIVDDDDDDEMTLGTLINEFTADLVPIFVYALADDFFTKQEIIRLKKLRELVPEIAIFFVKVPHVPHDNVEPSSTLKSIRCMLDYHDAVQCSRTTALMDRTHSSRMTAVTSAQLSLRLFQQLLELGYLNILPGAAPADRQSRLASDSDSINYYAVESELVENFDNLTASFVEFVHKVLHCHLLKISGLLNLVHTRCLQTFIMSAFDMARDMLITPKRITFAKDKESELYSSLMTMALKKQDEIRKIIAETIAGKKDELIEKAADYEFVGVEILPTGEVSSSSDLKQCTRQIQDLVLGDLNNAIGDKLLGSVDILKDSYTGVLTRCLESLEQSDVENNKELTRTSVALSEILTSAYQVEITVRAGASIVKILLEKMKQLMHSMPWHQAPRIDTEWKKQVATNMLNSLSEARLAKSVCSQIKERLKYSHETFSAALKQLEARHSGRLEKTEEQGLRVRKVHAPHVARLALESTSFKDMLMFGVPNQGREIGRGQYGVVHACEKWGGFSPCAIKSVVPPDDRHWNDLAMEFFYTKNIPEHDRIVTLRGSVIDYDYSGSNPAVLLIMDRLVEDLYTAIRCNLSWPKRLQVAIDVVEGIRYLHSQGLVHRDIKLKNVLLDRNHRGKLTDLGFCKPEAMMSGSIVGTPIHMAPELFSGRYDNSVDTYAFGILFWYVCAGHVHLPGNFEQCTNKEMLWTSVRRGIRPEKLPQFDPECWELMQSCWDGEPSRRPLLGFVEPKLHAIHARVLKKKSSARSCKKISSQVESQSSMMS